MSAPHLRQTFLRAMQAELDANQERKGDWDKLMFHRADQVDKWLEEHVDKLMVAVNAGDRAKVREAAADVGNIAMKIDECFGPAVPEDVIDHVRFSDPPALQHKHA